MKENANPSEWYFSSDEYSPNLTVENWIALLKNPEIFNENSRFVMKCIVENGGQATCQELAEHFGKTETFYQNVVKRLAKRIQLKTGCTLTYANNDGKYWYDSILFLKKRDEISGTWIWKMRDELKEAWEIFQPSQTPIIPSYTESDFLNEVYLSPQQYHTLTSLWKRKKNIILQGSTGVGKTFSAKRLAYAMMGKKDDSQIEFVQFHQSYSYEEFIMGYRPDRKGKLTLKEGIFYQFCKKAEQHPEKDYFFIIDEINRGNLSKIFGELLMLLEHDKRGNHGYSVRLAYQEEQFSIPENLYLIGMMNTADHSLSMMDYALRRRFSFYEMKPAFDSQGFQRKCSQWNSPEFHALIQEIQKLNQAIQKDPALGKGFCIGHSYFCHLEKESNLIEQLYSIIEYDIFPLLQEYWFDEEEKAERWNNQLLHTIGIKNSD